MTYRYRIAVIFLAGFFIDCINIFMSAIALPDIAKELHIAESSIAWVANSYILGLTLIIPLSTWLASHFGVRQIMAASMLLFSLAALCAGLTDHFIWLVIFRFFQGVGGGLLIPVGQALTFSLFKKQERVRISTLIMTVALIAPALSPTVGGAIVDHFSWRWVFFCNIPFSLITALLALIWIESVKTIAVRPDLFGLLWISLSLATFLLGMSWYADAGQGWMSLSLVLAGMVFALLYFRHFQRKTDPILDLHLLKNARMRFSVMVYHAIPGLFTGINLLNIFYLQNVMHWSASATGMLMMLYGSGAFCAMMVCGRLYNVIGALPLFFMGLVLHASGIGILALVNGDGSLPLLIVAYLMMGIGGGIGANTAQTTAMIDFDDESLARASTIWNVNRQIAFSLGAALLMLIFNLLQPYTTTTSAYHFAFIIAAALGLMPLFRLSTVGQFSELLCNQIKR